MATFTITHVTRLDDYAVVQTLESTDIGIGQNITISGLTNSSINGTRKVLAVPVWRYEGVDDEGDWLYNYDELITNQLLVASSGDDIAREADAGTITWTQTCTWIVAADVLAWLGISVATANDNTFVGACTDAANAFAFRRRFESGYTDQLTTVPSADVKLGTIMYAGVLYRERGSVDSFASFSDMGTTVTMGGSMGQINRLLGVNRSQVA